MSGFKTPFLSVSNLALTPGTDSRMVNVSPLASPSWENGHMGRAEDEVRALLDATYPTNWRTVPEPGPDPIRWVNENAADLVRANAALREALISLAKEVDRLRDSPGQG
jgi:hypothetical protein